MPQFDPIALHQKLSRADSGFYTAEACREIAFKLDAIAELKRERNAVILAHNYQRPEIFEVADYVGDSLGLSLQAAEVVGADVIIFCGVHFMAETAKVVSPSKIVILPNLKAGCSLADAADAYDVAKRIEELRQLHPDLASVCYINTTAAVKALCDATCTSANAADIVRAIPGNPVLFIPDQNLARHVADQVPEKQIIPWEGYCYVHHEIQPQIIIQMRRADPEMKVLVHPECREDVVRLADAALSTSGMVRYAQQSTASRFLAVTECGLSDLLSIQVPDKQFFRACKICRFMKMISLDDIIASLDKLTPEIILPADVLAGAERCIRRMFELTDPDKIPAILASTVD